MFDYTNLHDVFPKDVQIPYDRKLQQEIEAHRKHADGILFIDRVLKALGIQKGKVYPPKTDNALRQLHQQICEAGMSMHHKFSLLYYILLDFDDLSNDIFVSERFSTLSSMPANYQLFMKGLWYMDRQEYPRALEYVAHPSLDPDFADDIVIALVKQASNDDFSLALSYYYSVQPIFKSSVALEMLFDAMARTNVTEALLYSRTYPQHAREQLFRRWVSTVLDTRSGEDLSSRTSELAFTPLDSLEEAWFEEYLTVGEGRNLRKAKDTLLIRKIACDRFDEVGRYRAGGQWASILEGIKAGTEGQMD
ncbi:hypothetical protein QQS21_011751 [Conoideocrella luteorostrata]|uniref:ELYS-like domain-containing protein n=1 Tax=Conoideocrella luteorostrata TaxID=1105319 RepID=A0AAJ0CFB1_9HYPO|nr:hypothetical protein QQS21_011751 [Conoideocrella luteorostrata]